MEIENSILSLRKYIDSVESDINIPDHSCPKTVLNRSNFVST